MPRLKAHNWDEYQNYSNRRPPWIKVHADVLNNPKIMTLDLASIGLLMLAWLLCSQSDQNGSFECDLDEISFKLRRTITLDSFKPLLDKGLLTLTGEDASACLQELADACQRRGEERRDQRRDQRDKLICPIEPDLPGVEEPVKMPNHAILEILENDFKEWYGIYPRKLDPKKALKAYIAARRAGATKAEIIAGLKAQLPELLAREKQYVKHPTSWLNAGAWKNEPDQHRPPDGKYTDQDAPIPF